MWECKQPLCFDRRSSVSVMKRREGEVEQSICFRRHVQTVPSYAWMA